ncbi:hypothetical protein O7635_26630 [Asanoa sp. WMMD1127]|uniref:hypothetical protein n=1 Tax=Asanoa sp. WMMD1127 TaxID=3016107 RepID=UPI002415B881|nr:hypothetical protein [Asanoa sp. WMMD1127]MDG4825439.1 hypothetical protein [Asanoa sp. WMMD1127]
MDAFRTRLAVMVLATLALGGVLSWLAGLWPGADEPRATVDHCYVTYDRQEVRHHRCVGNWTRGGHGHRGPIHGVDVGTSWQALDPEHPNEAYEWEVRIPESAKHPRVLADTQQAWTLSPRALPWAFAPALVTGVLAVLLWFLVATVRARRVSPSPLPAGHPRSVSPRT